MTPQDPQRVHDTPTQAWDSPPASASVVANLSRRRFVGKGVAVPAVLTVASLPVMANGVCFTASAATSLHPSGLVRHTANSTVNCAGSDVGYWAQQAARAAAGDNGMNTASLAAIGWPAAYPPDREFSNVFKPRPAGIKKNHTLAEVLAMNNQPAAQAVVATLLNVASGKVDPRVLSGRTPQDIWRLMNSTAGFVPFAGAKPWSAAKVTAWLATTWGGTLPSDFANSM